MGRPRTFDRDEALEQAADLFRERGYRGTSIAELLTATGLSRASLYHEFGGKRELFEAVIDRYAAQARPELEAHLFGDGSPLENIRATIRALGERAACRDSKGCLCVHTAVELGATEPDLAGIAKRRLEQMERLFARAVQGAVDAGELPTETDVRALARFLQHTAQGLVVQGRAGNSKAAIRDVVEVSLRIISTRAAC